MARNGENIYKRKDGRWEARFIYTYNADGRAKYRSVYGRSRQVVKEKRLVMIHEHMMGNIVTISPVITFNDLAINWLNNTKLHVKESTFSRYNTQVQKHILPYLGKYQALKISTELIEQLMDSLLNGKGDCQSELSPQTVGDILIIVKSILKHGKCYNHLELNRIKIMKENKKPQIIPKMIQKRLHNYLTDDINYIKAGVLLCLHSGIRIGELCALRWGDIDLEEKTINIERTIQRIQVHESSITKTKIVITSAKSKKSVRKIPIPTFLTMILCKLSNDVNNYLLTGSNKYMEPRALDYNYKKILNQAGIDNYNFHTLRHTFATNYINAGFDAKSLSEILGHSNVKITLEKYVHSSDELKRLNMDKLIDMQFDSPS